MVLDNLAAVVRSTGGLGVVGVYMSQDPGGATDLAKQGRYPLRFGTFSTKGQSMGAGQCPVKRYNRQLRDLIIAGKATPGTLVSHDLPLEEAPQAYEKLDERIGGYTKVLLHPAA